MVDQKSFQNQLMNLIWKSNGIMGPPMVSMEKQPEFDGDLEMFLLTTN